MGQAFDAETGDGVPQNESENAHQSLIGEVIDFVKEHKTVSTIAGIGAAAGAIYLARVPLGRLLGRFGGGLFAAEEAATVAAKVGKAPIGRQLAVTGEELIVGGSKVETVAGVGIKGETAVAGALKTEVAAAGDDAIVSVTKATEPAAVTTTTSDRPLLDALGQAAKDGKTRAPEPWVYHPENRPMLQDLPKGGASDIKAAGESLETIGTVGSTHTPDATEITKIAFRGITKPPVIDVTKHRFLKGK